MTKSEGRSGKGVEDGRVDLGVVLVVVSIGDGEDVDLSHVVGAKDDGEPLVVGDMLVLSNDNLPGLLIQSLVIPVRVEVVELLGNSVVFSHPNSVENCQSRLFVHTIVT